MSQDISCLWLKWIVWIVLRAGQRCTNGALERKNRFVSALIHLRILIKDFFIKFILHFVTWVRLAKIILSSGDCDVNGPAVFELLPVCVFACLWHGHVSHPWHVCSCADVVPGVIYWRHRRYCCFLYRSEAAGEHGPVCYEETEHRCDAVSRSRTQHKQKRSPLGNADHKSVVSNGSFVPGF